MTDSELIDLLGGTTKTAELLKVQPTVVSNWRKRGIPGRHHLALAAVCHDKDINWPASRKAA